MISAHINSNIKVLLFRVKALKATMSNYCNINSDLPNTFI